MTNYACVKNIVSLEIDVSEKIDKENLKDFAFTSLILNNKNFSKNDLIPSLLVILLLSLQFFFDLHHLHHLINLKIKI